jgi:valyl-tRNA synthetase
MPPQNDRKPSSAPEIFLQPYSPKEHEPRIYAKWEESGYFNPDVCVEKGVTEADAEPFSIIMPPPNANGSLHAGHALFVTLEDIMIRFNRMRGKKTVWFPGADHAGFETQVVYEKKLEKEGRSRFEMTREELYAEILDFTLANKSFMEGQLRQLGASCDWSRSLFTLDARVTDIVYATFKKLEEDKLLYRGKRIVNWCPKHQTSLSNLETDHVERKDPFYYFKYGPFTIGTVRPETKFGDKYVVMHPDDERYSEFTHGQKLTVEWINGPIEATIIKDEASDPAFGSGVMTITPWHSGVDFEIAKKHNLDMEQIIDERGKLLPIAGEFAGINIKDARQKIVEKLEAKGLLVKVDTEYSHDVSVCYKCEREIEPQVKAQWFIQMQPLAEKALTALDRGEINILTEQHEKVFRHWMGSIQDWNISRQIAWGIPIPAKICDACDKGYVDIENTLTTCPTCGGEVRADTDTFDTWFSSGQWPLATTDFPNGKDFTTFYPTNVMETAADILFFWVARMIMLGMYRTGKVPFKDVYLHGVVRDAHGKKMSKSKGNVISPLEVSDTYGTDALRMGLIVNNAPGVDMNLDPKKIEAYKKFANKMWNVSRFILDALGTETFSAQPELREGDAVIMGRLQEVVKEVTTLMDKYQFHLASEKLYHYAWNELADVILEESKPILQGEDVEARRARLFVLKECLLTVLKLLHPYMPFVTETIWEHLPPTVRENEHDLLMVASWPKG